MTRSNGSLSHCLKAGKAGVIRQHITRKEQRSCDKHLYQVCDLIENFFAKLKQYRAIAMRYDKTARNLMCVLHLA